jgi:hypothetical protein
MTITQKMGVLALAFNTYLIDMADEWQQPLIKELEIEKHLDTVYTQETYAEINMAVSNVIQTYKGKFSPSGNILIGSMHNTLDAMKTDLQIQEDQIEFFAKTQFPAWNPSTSDTVLDNGFTQKFLNEFFGNQWKREMNTVSIKGVKVAATADTVAGTVLGSINGFNKVFTDGIAAGNVNQINMDFSTATDFSTKLKTALKQIPEDLYNEGGYIYMNPKHVMWYSEDFRAKNQFAAQVITDSTGMKLMIDDFKFAIIPISAMSGLDRIYLDVHVNGKKNMIVGKHSSKPDMPTLNFIPTARGLDVTGNWHRFYGLRRYEYTFVIKPA